MLRWICRGRWAQGVRLWPIGLCGWLLCGCETAQFYAQAIRGQTQILARREPIVELIVDPGTSTPLKEKFELVLRLRAFAEQELKLPIDDHYLTYVDLKRRFAVWNVHAAPAYSLKPKKWWYPLVGSLKYRGYFSQEDALDYAEDLAKEGADVYVEGVEAYSTLGWFEDPLLNTFIFHGEADLAEILFHELAHQRLFLMGDTDFNEAFATAVAEEGVRRWFLTHGEEEEYARYRLAVQRHRQFVSIVLRAREQLEDLYDENETREGARFETQPAKAVPSWMVQEKARIIAALKEQYEKLRSTWGGYSGYDRWFSHSLGNAQLNTIAVYYELVPGFRRLLDEEDGNLERFYARVRSLRKLEKEQRHEYLRGLGAAEPDNHNWTAPERLSPLSRATRN